MTGKDDHRNRLYERNEVKGLTKDFVFYGVCAIFFTAITFYALLAFFPASDGGTAAPRSWSEISDLLNGVLGLPLAIAGTFFALLLAGVSLIIALNQEDSELSKQASDTLFSANQSYLDLLMSIDNLYESDRLLRTSSSTVAGTQNDSAGADRGAIPDQVICAAENLSTAKRELKRSILQFTSSPLAFDMLQEGFRQADKCGNLISARFPYQDYFDDKPEHILNGMFRKDRNLEDFIGSFLMVLGDDSMAKEPSEVVENSLMFSRSLQNYFEAKEDISAMTSSVFVPGLRMYHCGGHLAHLFLKPLNAKKEAGQNAAGKEALVNVGAIFLHDILASIPTAEMRAERLQRYVASIHNKPGKREKVIDMMAGMVDLRKISASTIPQYRIKDNFSQLFYDIRPKVDQKATLSPDLMARLGQK